MTNSLEIVLMAGAVLIPVNWIFAKVFKKLLVTTSAPHFVRNSVAASFTIQFCFLIAAEVLIPYSGNYYAAAISGAALFIACIILSPIIIFSIALLIYRKTTKLYHYFYIIFISIIILLFLFYTLINPREAPVLELHGKIIDQNNEPVVGATIYYRGLRDGEYFGNPVRETSRTPNIKLYYGEKAYSNTVTDNSGIFHIKGFGKRIAFYTNNIDIENHIIHIPYANKAIGDRFRYEITFSNYTDSNKSIEDVKNYSSKNPYLIRAWKINNKKEYMAYSSRNHGVRMKPNNTIYTLVDEGINGIKFHEGDKDGLLKVSCLRGAINHHRDKINWRLVITPVNGGIQKTKDYYLNEAPENGYSKNLIYNIKKDSLNYKHKLHNEMFYFFSNNRKEYGSVLFHFDPISRKGCRLKGEHIKLNKNGKRQMYSKKELLKYQNNN